jgi:hypothetical protein
MVHILKIPKADIIWINKLMSAKALTTELARFKTDVNKESLNQKTARYIIGTTGAFAVGLMLSEAISVGLLEPDFRAATMIQSMGRHCRQGNKNELVCSWLFLAKWNVIEERIRMVNRLRAQITSAVAKPSDSAMEDPGLAQLDEEDTDADIDDDFV